MKKAAWDMTTTPQEKIPTQGYQKIQNKRLVVQDITF